MLAQRAARILIQRFHIIGHLIARDHAQRFNHLKRKSACQPRQRLVPAEVQQGLKQKRNLAVDKVLQPALHLLRHIRTGLVINESLHGRLHYVGSCNQLAHRMLTPHQAALLGVVNLCIRRIIEAIRAQMELGRQRLNRRRAQGFRFIRRRRGILLKAKPLKPSHKLIFDGHFAFVVDVGHKALLLLQPAQQN